MTDSRTRIQQQIRDSLAVNRATLLAHAEQDAPPYGAGPFMPNDLEPVEQFRTELSALHATVHICDGQQAALDKVHELLEATSARQVLTWALDQVPLPGLSDTLAALGVEHGERQVQHSADRAAALQALDPVPVCITGVDAAVAESGSMLLVSGPGRGRLASLLPPMHIALLPADRIVPTLPQAFDLLRERFGDTLFRDQANLTIITGPSRTADIELSLTLGVHGPRDIHAIVIC